MVLRIGEQLALESGERSVGWGCLMSRVPLDERRQLFLTRQRARQAMRDQLLQPVPAQPLSRSAPSYRHLRLVVKAVMIAMLLGMGLVTFHAVTFHPPTSIVEALLPGF